jgi:hypothetical protein
MRVIIQRITTVPSSGSCHARAQCSNVVGPMHRQPNLLPATRFLPKFTVVFPWKREMELPLRRRQFPAPPFPPFQAPQSPTAQALLQLLSLLPYRRRAAVGRTALAILPGSPPHYSVVSIPRRGASLWGMGAWRAHRKAAIRRNTVLSLSFSLQRRSRDLPNSSDAPHGNILCQFARLAPSFILKLLKPRAASVPPDSPPLPVSDRRPNARPP